MRCQPMVKAVSGEAALPWASAGLLSCSTRPQARLQGASSRAVCASAGPRVLARALADLCQPRGSPGVSQTWRGPASLGASRGQAARGTRLADSRRSRVRL